MHPLKLSDLSQPLGGLFTQVRQLRTHPGEPDFPIYISSLGDISKSLPHVAKATMGRSIAGDLDGAGGEVDEELAKIKALAEGLERYSCCVYDEEQFIWATAKELGSDALDLNQIPK
jgi:ribosomal protein S12 methylthiotransferase accessory factor